MNEELLQLIFDCGDVIVSLLLDPIFVVAAVLSSVAWMFGAQGQHQNPNPLRIVATAGAVLLPLAIYLGVRIWRDEAARGFEGIAALAFSMGVAAVIVMFALFGVFLAVAFLMTVLNGRSGK